MSSETETNSFEKPGRCLYNCEAKLRVNDSCFYVCKERLSQMSGFFKRMFMSDYKEKTKEKYEIFDEKRDDILLFLKALELEPEFSQITRKNSEILMRLADKYQVPVLKNRLETFVLTTCASAMPGEALKYLGQCVKYNMSDEAIFACIPGAACASLDALQRDKEKIGLDLYSKILEAKLKASFQKTTNGKLHYLTVPARPRNYFKCDCGTHHQSDHNNHEGCVQARQFYRNALKNAINH